MPWETNFDLFGHSPYLRGKSSCWNVLDRNTQECGTMQHLAGHAYCCNRNTSSAHAATCKKLAYRLSKPGKLKYSWWGQPLVQGMVMWASLMCLEFEAGSWALFLLWPSCWKAPERSQWSCQECSADHDTSWLASGGRVSLSLHPGCWERCQATTFLSGLTTCSWPFLRWIWAWRRKILLQQFSWATECPAVLQSDQAYLPRNHK